MRVRALVIASALVAGTAVAGSAAPAIRPTSSPASGLSGNHAALGLHRDDFRTAATLRAARVRVLAEQRLAAHRADLAATQQAVWGYANTESALPDVDGDGVGDVLSSRLFARTPSLKVLSGRTGRTLWSVASPATTVAAVYVPAPGGKSVMVVLTDVETGEQTPAAAGATDLFTISAVNPKTGAAVWSTSITGVIEADPVGALVAGAGEFDGVLMRKGTTPYLLLDRFNLDFNGATFTTSLAPEVVDATNGNVVHAGAPLGGDEFTFATPVGDLDADGIDDYLICAGGDVPTVTARSGATGKPLWTSESASYAFLISLAQSPDLSGDHKPDVLLGWFAGSGTIVNAVDGSSGSNVWSVPGDFAEPIGDIDHDGRSDSRVSVGGLRTTFTAMSGKGTRLWSRDVFSPSGTHGDVWDPGDLDGDHYADTYVEFTSDKGEGGGPGKAAASVSGRTGASHALPDLGWPLGQSLRGGAPSFIRGVTGKKGYVLTAYDGRSHRAFWRTVVKGSDIQRIATFDVVGLGHGRVGLLVLLSARFTDTVAVLDGKSGKQLWTSTYETQGDGVPIFL
jgi:hypothetical protein